MPTIFSAIGLAVLVLITIGLLKAYTQVPIKELKRRVRSGDNIAARLYKASSYGTSLKLLLWIFIAAFAAGLFVLVARLASGAAALLFNVILLVVVFVWLPNSRVSKPNIILASWLASPLAWILRQGQPVLERLIYLLTKYRRVEIHSGIYEKDDLIALLKRQKRQADNRISEEELNIAINALCFGEKMVREVLVPRRQVKIVSAMDTIGPVLMDELHKSGHSRFPVYQDKPDNIVGMLYVRDLVDVKGGGQVKSIMKKDVYYVREDRPLNHVLDAFIKTKHHLFIVVNNFEEMVGIITMEDVLEQILGKPILDEFDQYQDLRAVATFDAGKQHEEYVSDDKVIE